MSALLIVTVLLGVGAGARQPDPRFEVASIKRNTSDVPQGGGTGGGAIGRRGQRFVATNATLREIIRYAFELEPFQRIENGPGLLNDRYDITAIMPDQPTSVDVSRAMLRVLLGERFKLSVRLESREQAVFALVFARSDKRLGPTLKPSTTDCRTVGVPASADGLENYLRGEGLSCDMFYQPYRARIAGGARSLAELARVLSRVPTVGAPVVDRTGLAGVYDFDLTYSPAALTAAPGSPTLAADGSYPSLFVALQEQLGLKLEPTRGPVEVLVIESVSAPTEN